MHACRWPLVTAAAQTVLHWRLRALPYTYTAHHTAHITGCPIARPLFFAFPSDSNSLDVSTQVHESWLRCCVLTLLLRLLLGEMLPLHSKRHSHHPGQSQPYCHAAGARLLSARCPHG